MNADGKQNSTIIKNLVQTLYNKTVCNVDFCKKKKPNKQKYS